MERRCPVEKFKPTSNLRLLASRTSQPDNENVYIISFILI